MPITGPAAQQREEGRAAAGAALWTGACDRGNLRGVRAIAEDAKAWTGYWRQAPAQAMAACLPCAPRDVNLALSEFWSGFARRLPAGARVIDLGCGTGAVALLIAGAGRLEVTGVDFAAVPPLRQAGVRLCPGVRIEALPFGEGEFDAAVSQFGIEYADIEAAVGELDRVLAEGAPIAFLVHHAGSPIVAHNRARKAALEALSGADVKAAFLGADAAGLRTIFRELADAHPGQNVIQEFAHGLGQVSFPPGAERGRLWEELAERIAAERAILAALAGAALSPAGMEAWTARLGSAVALDEPALLRNAQGEPIAWAVTGRRRPSRRHRSAQHSGPGSASRQSSADGPAAQLIARVERLLREGDEAEAARALGETEALPPLAPEPSRRLAVLARSIDRNDLALSALARGPDGLDRALMALQLRLELGQAVADEVAEALGPNAAPGPALLQLAGALHQEGRSGEAIDRLAAGVAADPGWIAGHSTLAQLRWQVGEGKGSSRSFAEAATVRPDEETIWTAWLTTLKVAGDREGFAVQSEAARRRLPSSAPIAMVCADGLSEMGRTAEADGLFAALANVADPDFDAARMRHAMRNARFEDAIAIGSRAIVSHGHGECWAWLGAAWRLAGDPRGEWFHRGTELIRAIDLPLADGELPRLAACLRRLHQGAAHPLGQSPRGGTQTAGPLLKRAEPEISALRAHLAGAVRTYIDGLPPADPRHPLLGRPRRGFRFEGAWSVLLRGAGHHVSHIHSRGWISSALYVELPAGMTKAADQAGWLGFGIPPLPEQGAGAPVAMLPPVAGRLVLFPSVFWHGTRPFAAGERLTVAFDVVGR